MFDCISDKTNIALYADDKKIWREIIVWEDHLALQNDIDNLLRWANINKNDFPVSIHKNVKLLVWLRTVSNPYCLFNYLYMS